MPIDTLCNERESGNHPPMCVQAKVWVTGLLGVSLLVFSTTAQASWKKGSDWVDIFSLPSPTAAQEIEISGTSSQSALKYKDKVEITLLRLVQAFTLGHPEKYLEYPPLIEFFQRHQELSQFQQPDVYYTSPEGLTIRAEWADVLARQRDLMYVIPENPSTPKIKTHQLVTSWENIQDTFEFLFPDLGTKLQSVHPTQISRICNHFQTGFSCYRSDYHDESLILNSGEIGTRKVYRFNIEYLDMNYVRWTLSEDYDAQGNWIDGESSLEDRRIRGTEEHFHFNLEADRSFKYGSDEPAAWEVFVEDLD